ncbi:MAG: hypothetical protein ACREQA_01690 [Candidatus Binatia bacterium]
MKAEGCEGEGRGRRDVAVSAGPGSGSNHPKGMAWVVLEALAHRPRPEDSHPEETRFRRNSSVVMVKVFVPYGVSHADL